MNLKVTQSQVGRYDLLSNEESFVFQMGIFCDGQGVKDENGELARIYYSGEPDKQCDFDDPFDNLDDVFIACWNYAQRVISTRNYRMEALAIGNLVDCRPMTKEDEIESMVKFREGLWCHVFEDVRGIEEFDWKGTVGYRDVPQDVQDCIVVHGKGERWS